ncbi:MAG TPA: ImmA/IrrE family metallo-endopeptidase [Dongiaceae bacterium]|jgi:Zn-dependent peptidase ImmA (M78 family)/plasmid maintenance system antidote protein VapI|nr:ImmA/IrrE family metallo-endopeptidase [Dongiaceae bacterium]
MTNIAQLPTFDPDWVVPPGATIAAILADRGISRGSFAETLGESIEAIQRLLLGLEVIDKNLADRLSKCLGSPSAFWMAREAQYRIDSKKIQDSEAKAAREAWIKQFPIHEMATYGWIAKFQSLNEAATKCLNFFGVPDVATWQARYSKAASTATFRISASARFNPGSVTAWLRWAELVAGRTPCNHWDSGKFRTCLQAARRMTWQKNPGIFLPRLRQLCAEAGVAVVVARTPRGCPASGATCFLSPNKAMMVLSFRYRSDDQFWFTFFHEAAHLLLHGRDLLFLEDEGEVTLDEEKEANEFAEEILIPSHLAKEFNALQPDKDSILCFARSIGIAPGLIVGQLQYGKRLAHDRLNWLKRRYDWDQIEADRLIP